jgi:tRNA(fMet)-specific endonuclease VapC
VTRFTLDTNVVISLINRRASRLGEHVRSHTLEDIVISAIVLHELYFGSFASGRRDKNISDVQSLRFPILAFDAEDARQSGELRAALRMAGTPIGSYDILIAGQAVAKNLTLVTDNVREFNRVPGLTVENWLEDYR